ncbi:MAG: hypothetical protein JXM70_29730, partial [Pirellulales bacterium]|nr:hypothetical protein [Pirellulales bacterium]
MNSKQRVIAAMRFQQPDRVPRYWSAFWPEFEANWKSHHGDDDIHSAFGDDMFLVAPDETAWPGRAGVIENRGDKVLVRSGWGEVKLTQAVRVEQQLMGELVEAALPERVDPETL